jgi:hypothetical protein
MTTSQKFKKAVEDLRTKNGTHYSAAEDIGIHPVYYRQIRNGKHRPSRTLVELIILKAQAFRESGR